MESQDYFSEKMELSPSDFNGASLKSTECALVLFYAPWCGYCKLVKEPWKQLASTVAYIDVFAFNCEKNKSYLQRIKEEHPYLIPGYPTIVFYKNGKVVKAINSKSKDEDENSFKQRLVSISMDLCKSN